MSDDDSVGRLELPPFNPDVKTELARHKDNLFHLIRTLTQLLPPEEALFHLQLTRKDVRRIRDRKRRELLAENNDRCSNCHSDAISVKSFNCRGFQGNFRRDAEPHRESSMAHYPSHSQNGGGLYPSHSQNGGGLYPNHSQNGGGLYPSHSQNGGGLYPSHPRNGGGLYPNHLQNNDGHYPSHPQSGGGLYPRHSQNGLYPAQHDYTGPSHFDSTRAGRMDLSQRNSHFDGRQGMKAGSGPSQDNAEWSARDGEVEMGSLPGREQLSVADESSSEESGESVEDRTDAIELLQSWTVRRKGRNLYIAGTIAKTGERYKGQILSRSADGTIRTHHQRLIALGGTIQDPRNVIPEAVKEFLKGSTFPRNWRKLITLWDEEEKKNDPDRKNKSSVAPVKKKTPKSGSKSKKGEEEVSEPKRKDNTRKEAKNISVEKTKSSDPVKKKIPKSGNKSKKGEEQRSEPKRKDNTRKTEGKKAGSGQGQTEPPPRPPPSTQERGRLDELIELETNFPFELTKMSLTPNALVNSIAKDLEGEGLSGRCTPPTRLMDFVLGIRDAPGEGTNSSAHQPAPLNRNKYVAKRMTKAKKAKVKGKGEDGGGSRVGTEQDGGNEEVGGVMRGLAANCNTTPTVLKQIFSNQNSSLDSSRLEETL